MATIKALNDTLYPAALAGLLVVAFTASHTNAPAAAELDGATPFGANGIEYLNPKAAVAAGKDDIAVIPADDKTLWSGKIVTPSATLELVIDEVAGHAGQAGEHAVRVLLTGSELASSL